MKTIICREINEFYQTETEAPVPQQGEALVRIRRIGICGTDLHAFKGNQPYFTYPRILGHELSGTVEAIAGEARGIAVGDQVAVIPYLECGSCIACRSGKTNCCTQMRVLGVHTDGGMREFIAVPADHLIVTNGLTLDQSAVLEPLSIGAHAVRRADPQPGENVLVIGAGPIGLGVMAIAKQRGARVIAMDMNDARLAFCREWAGADAVVNVRDNPQEQLRELTDGEFPSIVFDATGNAKSMESAFQYVSHGGKLVYVGLVSADIRFNDPEFHKREMTLMGSRNATREDFEVVMKALSGSAVDINAYITHRAGFDTMIERFEDWLNPANGVIKAVVEL
ncbi:zinc-binding alcohol dehydrogenase family protein [Paenibacillus doosanensis]|uniref:L-galactonate oxidoreductase n=1 Tax=Paenibacillus konkukensis TaxID=2020716 RepID=A0ABY4RM25_9BACL|nr:MULTISPECIES: zinc-binding alcohol dehydrogenase family protein [Paenibacillus]MCS7462119.1 zinc-binding alcohol dehydrogenase family protein [Paenibacillus doosanensis]UQZ83499.1 Putative L-galactonate oxidoreductase [Paenibacillus konkukensis]